MNVIKGEKDYYHLKILNSFILKIKEDYRFTNCFD